MANVNEIRESLKRLKKEKEGLGLFAFSKKKEKDVEMSELQKNLFDICQMGDVFELGEYEGEAISWLVLQADMESVLAISQRTLGMHEFDVVPDIKSPDGMMGKISIEWRDSELFRWMNNEYYKLFNSNEKKWFGFDAFDILSEEEVQKNKKILEGNLILGNSAERWWTKTWAGNMQQNYNRPTKCRDGMTLTMLPYLTPTYKMVDKDLKMDTNEPYGSKQCVRPTISIMKGEKR